MFLIAIAETSLIPVLAHTAQKTTYSTIFLRFPIQNRIFRIESFRAGRYLCEKELIGHN